MTNDKGYNRIKKVLQIVLILLIIVLVSYIALVLFENKNDKDFLGKVETFFKVFTTGVDTGIVEDNNTILENEEDGKKVDIETKVDKKPQETIVKPEVKPLQKPSKIEPETYAAADSDSTNSVYYNQLDNYGKIMYTKLKNESAYFLEGEHTFDFGYAFNDLLNTNGGDQILKSAFQYSINALLFDYPELFFVDIESLSLAISRTEYNNNTAVNKVSIANSEGSKFYIRGINSKEEVNKLRESVYSERNKILNASKHLTTIERIKYIQNHIIDNTEYDQTLSKANIYNLLGPLLDGYAVCEGYARAFKFLMDGANIPTIIVAGKGYDGAGRVERHAWNYVKLNGNWYLVDVTWNDPIITGGGSITDKERYQYFLVGKEFTKNSHVEDGNIVDDANFKYPQLSIYGFGR